MRDQLRLKSLRKSFACKTHQKVVLRRRLAKARVHQLRSIQRDSVSSQQQTPAASDSTLLVEKAVPSGECKGLQYCGCRTSSVSGLQLGSTRSLTRCPQSCLVVCLNFALENVFQKRHPQQFHCAQQRAEAIKFQSSLQAAAIPEVLLPFR